MTERLLTTDEVAGLVAVSPEWVREHAAELGAIRIGDGPKGHLRFERQRVMDALERRRVAAAPAARTTRRRPGRRQQPRDDVELFEPPRWAA